MDTYARCVEAICGNADTFFTSVFSAQGKRQLSAYRNAEIKTLLADLLGQEEIRVLGQKAAETARLLKIGLAAIRQERSGLDDDALRIGGEQQRLEGAVARVAQSLAARQGAQATLETARSQHAQLVAEREQAQGVELRRKQLQGECRAVIQAGTEAIEALKAQEQGASQRQERLAGSRHVVHATYPLAATRGGGPQNPVVAGPCRRGCRSTDPERWVRFRQGSTLCSDGGHMKRWGPRVKETRGYPR